MIKYLITCSFVILFVNDILGQNNIDSVKNTGAFISEKIIKYRKIVDVIKPKISEWVIPRWEKMTYCGNIIPTVKAKITSISGEIPPKAPSSLFLLRTAAKIM